MVNLWCISLTLFLTLDCFADNTDFIGSARDSYLNAFTESHDEYSDNAKNNRQYTEALDYPYPAPQPNFQYGPPSRPPQPYDVYPPPTKYGPPTPVYQSPVPVYNPPPPFYGMPYGMLGILDKLKWKLDLFLIGKIILKLVIFKKIISLIAILCLLLFIPSLKEKIVGHHAPNEPAQSDDNDEGMMRKYRNIDDDSINNLTYFLESAIHHYSRMNRTLIGKSQNAKLKLEDQTYYGRMVKLHSMDSS